MRWNLLVACLAACGAKPTAPSAPAEQHVVKDERTRHDEIATAHRKLESEQQDALGATCANPGHAHPRCLPSCYETERPDPRAGKKLAGTLAIEHLVCEHDGTTLIADELDAKLAVSVAHGRIPKPDATLGMTVSGKWRSVVHPLMKQTLRCTTATEYKKIGKPLDACASDGSIGCEAIGDAAARGINVIHYRLLEARRLHASGDAAGCQQAALEAIAVARGMPRWRQYAKLNVDSWTERAKYRTRFDGLLDEDALFALAASLGDEAKQACGDPLETPTHVTDEQSFHMCW